MSKKNVVGIDLGTSFSSIARLDQYGRPEVLPNAEGEQMTPSAIYFGEEGPVIGKEALKSGSDDPERLIENAKRHLGSSFKGWQINGSLVTPLDASSHILRKLKSETEEQIGPIDGVVISVPVHFTIQQREMTILAARRVGLTVLGLVNEPVAGALTFILGEQGLAYAALADEQTILVYDLGGGTFDLSIVHYSDQGIDVKAATGDMKLGGIDWNQRLIDVIAQRFWDMRGYDIRRDVKMLRKLAENIEDAKRSLSNPKKPFTNVSIRYEGYSETFKITREEFEAVSKDLVERTRQLTDGLVRSTVRRWDLLNQVLPVGGATRMPMIREAIREMCVKTMGEVFGLEPNYRLSPDLAIAQGAALYAGLLAGDGPAGTEWAKQTYVPKMISSRGLGMAVRNHEGTRVNHILIPAGSRLPASVSVGVETIKPNQERISLKIVEAENEQFRDEDVLLRCEINNLPGDLPEGSGFDVDLTCEPSGLLQVVAKHRDSGRIATARLKRDMAAVGEVVDDNSLDTEASQEQAPVQDTTEEESALFDPLFESRTPASGTTQVGFSIRDILADATSPSEALFGTGRAEPKPPAAAPAQKKPAEAPQKAKPAPAKPASEPVAAETRPVKPDTKSRETAQAALKPEAAPVPEPTASLFDDEILEVLPDLDEPVAEKATLSHQEPAAEPILLEFFEDEEVIPLEVVEEMESLPLEVAEEPEPLPEEDPFEFRPDEEEPPQPKAGKLKPLSKKTDRDDPPPREASAPSKQKKLTPLSKRKGREDPPLSLD